LLNRKTKRRGNEERGKQVFTAICHHQDIVFPFLRFLVYTSIRLSSLYAVHPAFDQWAQRQRDECPGQSQSGYVVKQRATFHAGFNDMDLGTLDEIEKDFSSSIRLQVVKLYTKIRAFCQSRFPNFGPIALRNSLHA